MAWSFRKRVKIIPGVYLNLSKSGISTTIGPKGARVTFNKKGTYLNTSIPQLGLYNRQRLGSGKLPSKPANIYPHAIFETNKTTISSAEINRITSLDMREIKDIILLARETRLSLQQDLRQQDDLLRRSRWKLKFSHLFLYGFINKSISQKYKTNILGKEQAIEKLKEEIDSSYIQLKIDFVPEIKTLYSKLTLAFEDLINCHKIWDITSTRFEDRAITRSSASTMVERHQVSFSFNSITELKSDFNVLYFQNANGADLYIYPSFVVMYRSNGDFAIISIVDLELTFSQVRFTEQESVPRDANIMEYTWAKVNKNGSPDRRFKGNYQIPVVQYGEIRLQTKTGLNEGYKFSNFESAKSFATVFHAFQKVARMQRV